MRILHISAECYPAAKVGGLGDVVGALPVYLGSAGTSAGVIIPKYRTSWISSRSFITLHCGLLRLPDRYLAFTIEQLSTNELGFPLFVVSLSGMFDKAGVYLDPQSGQLHADETERRIYFQRAVLQWLLQLPQPPAVLHCHDHHCGLIPYLIRHCAQFRSISNLATLFTIHNGIYQGAFSKEKRGSLPLWDASTLELAEWEGQINPMAAGIRCCDKLSTVSPAYLEELQQGRYGLGALYRAAAEKSLGILNGIDTQLWDPTTDPLLHQHLREDVEVFKSINKKAIADRFNFDPARPLITFIGRLVEEKGADLLPEVISRYLSESPNANFVVLGTGQAELEELFRRMRGYFQANFAAVLAYDEALAHQLYAASDFLLMPSRSEPCGLNQLYALRYATVPIVRSTGGLRDTITDIGEPGGRGIRFDRFLVTDVRTALKRAVALFHDKAFLAKLRREILQLSFSWEESIAPYIKVYNELTDNP